MASAYELMLVLRGRNYLSNDLRRAGADIGRLKTQSGLTNARSQLQINGQRLATTRRIAQEEARSIQVGQRRIALEAAMSSNAKSRLIAADKLTKAESALTANQDAQALNAKKLADVQRSLNAEPTRSGRASILKEQAEQLAAVDQKLLQEQVALNKEFQVAAEGMTRVDLVQQKLIETEAAHAQRLSILTDKINTTNAALDLNTIKLQENALAIKKLPLETLGARARYVEHLGRAFQTLGLVSVAVLGYAAHAASKFQTELTLASTQATLIGDRSVAKVRANSKILQSAVQQMMIGGKTAVKPGDLNQGLYTIFSGLTLPGNQKQQLKEGLGILKEFSNVFTANFGQVEFNEVTKAGIALINNFGLKAKNIPVVMNQMQASVRFGAVTMSELTSSLNQVIPAFKAAGYGTKQMFQDIAFVSRVFPSLRMGTTGLARLTETFGKYHEAISQDIGTNIAPGGKLQSIATITGEIVKAHPILAKGGVDLMNYFKTVTGSSQFVNARRVFTEYVSQLGLYHKVAGQVGGDTKELAKSFTDMSQSPQVRWAEFTNELRALVLEIGTNALPIFQKMAQPIEKAVHWFDKLSPSTKKTISEFATWAAVGMLFGGTALVVIGALGRMYVQIRLLLLGKAGVAALEEGFLSSGAALRLGLIGALIVAIPLLIRYHTQLNSVANALGGWKNILGSISALLTALAFSKLIRNIAMIGLTAEASTAEVGVLRGALLGLTGLNIVVPIVLAYELNKHGHGDPLGLTQLFTKGGSLGDFLIGPAGHRGLIGDWLHKHAGIGRDAPPLSPDGLRPVDRLTHPGEIARAAARNAAAIANMTKNAKKAAAAKAAANFDVNAAIANVEKLRRISEKTPSIKNFQAYEDARAALEKHFTGSSLTALNDYLSAIESATKKSSNKVADTAKKAAAELKQELLDAASNAMSMYDSLLQQNQSIMGTIFSGPYINSPLVQNRLQFGGKLTGSDYLKDAKSQINQFKTFFASIGKLQKRGAPEELINQLIAAGPSALPAIKALTAMAPNQWKEYTKIFKSGQDLLHKQTMAQLQMQLKDYRKYGQKIALQIISGMRDKRVGLTNEIKNIIKSIFGATTPVTHGPSRTGTATHHHTHYHVTAPKSQHSSIKTQLRHAGFASKAKYERTK